MKTGNQTFSMRLRFLTTRASRAIQSPHDGDGELHIAFAIPSTELGPGSRGSRR
jgi:hypothetical protein